MRTRQIQDFSPRTKPMPHQIEAIKYIIDTQYSALFDEQGLGKTKIVIDAFSELMRRGEIDASLIVAPMGLVYNWEAEVSKHSNLIPVVLRGTTRQRKYRFLSGANFYIVNYEAIVGQLEIFLKMIRTRRFAVALDEATRIKDPVTVTAQAICSLGKHAVRRVIITGTPIANRPVDLWSQFFFLDEGRLLGKDFKVFADRFNPEQLAGESELVSLSETIRMNSIRRLKNDVLELPDKVYIVHDIDLIGSQREMYRRCADDLIVLLRSMTGETYLREVSGIFEKLLRLIQIASNPGLLDPHYNGPNAKIDYLNTLCDQLLEDHQKLIVWSGFISNIETVVHLLKRYRPLKIHGGVSIEERAEIVKSFQGNEFNRVLVANPAAAREGLTLTKASAAIYLDRTFNLVDYLQSQDRIHRIGQTRRCEIHKLIATNTIDEYVDVAMQLKECVANFVYSPTNERKSQLLKIRTEKDEILRFLGGANND